MSNLDEDDLRTVFENTIILAYRDCIWNNLTDSPCKGHLTVINTIPENKFFQFDYNCSVPMCEIHATWFRNSKDSFFRFLEIYPKLAGFQVINQFSKPQKRFSVESVRDYLLNKSKIVIKKRQAPFPTLYGKFDV